MYVWEALRLTIVASFDPSFLLLLLQQLRREYWAAVTSLWGLSFVFIPLQYVSFK